MKPLFLFFSMPFGFIKPPILRLASYDRCHKLRVMLLGTKGVGKSSIARAYSRPLREPKQTSEPSTYEIKVGKYVLEVLDTNCETACNIKRHSDVHSVDIFILVYAVNDVPSFDNVAELRDKIISIRGEKVPIFVVGNKTDLSLRTVHSIMADCIVSIDWEITHIEISAKTRYNVVELFQTLVNHPAFNPKNDMNSDVRKRPWSSWSIGRRRMLSKDECEHPMLFEKPKT